MFILGIFLQSFSCFRQPWSFLSAINLFLWWRVCSETSIKDGMDSIARSIPITYIYKYNNKLQVGINKTRGLMGPSISIAAKFANTIDWLFLKRPGFVTSYKQCSKAWKIDLTWPRKIKLLTLIVTTYPINNLWMGLDKKNDRSTKLAARMVVCCIHLGSAWQIKGRLTGQSCM